MRPVSVLAHLTGLTDQPLGMDEATGGPAALGLAQLLDGTVDKPGVHPPEAAIDPDRFFAALAERASQIAVAIETDHARLGLEAMIDYEGRRFRPEEAGGTEATYHQDGDIIWAEFSGGKVRRGALTGSRQPDGSLHFGYSMAMAGGELIVGRCRSTPSLLDDGRVMLTEQWERYWPHAAAGTSRIVEER